MNKKNILVILILAFAYFLGAGLFKTLQEFSLGCLARNMLPAIFIFFLILTCSFLESSNVKETVFSGPSLSLRTFFPVVGLSLILGVLLPWSSFSYFGLTTFLLVIIVLMLFISSLYFIFINKAYLAVIAFLFAFPIISYLESWFSYYFPTDFILSFLIITPTTSFILAIFIASLFTKCRILKTEINKYILLFLGVCVLASLLSKDPGYSLRELSLELIFPVLFYFLIIKTINTERQVKLLWLSLIAMILSISFMSLYLLRRYSGIPYLEITDTYGKLFQTHMSTSVWASMVTMVLPLTLVLTTESIRERVLSYLTTILFISFLFISYSRAAQLSSVITLFILFLSIRSSRKFITILLVIFVFLFITEKKFFRYHILQRYENIFVPSVDIMRDASFGHRIDGWYAAAQIIKNHPLLGIGNGLWKDYVYLYAPKQRIVVEHGRITKGYIATPHNYYLKVAVDSGIFALSSYLLFLIVVFRVGFKFITRSPPSTQKGMMVALLISLASWTVFSLALDNFYQGLFMGPGIVFWVIVAMVAVLPNLKEAVETKKIDVFAGEEGLP